MRKLMLVLLFVLVFQPLSAQGLQLVLERDELDPSITDQAIVQLGDTGLQFIVTSRDMEGGCLVVLGTDKAYCDDVSALERIVINEVTGGESDFRIFNIVV